MIILKFEKTSTAALTAHVDTLRAITRIFRRANLPVAYSQGYNPHMELSFSSPLALGVESLCEYVSAKADYAQGILDSLNAVCPQGIIFSKVWSADVNLAATINRATYLVEANGIGDVIAEILSDNYTVTYLDKGQPVTKDVSSRIFDAERQTADTALITLAVGNDNLRPDRLVCHLMHVHNLPGDYKITKIQSFVGDVPTDDYLTSKQKEQTQ